MSTLLALSIVLLVLMALIGGKTGLRSFLSIIINAILLILVAVLISWGLNIIILLLIFVPLKLATIIFLGTHDYTVAKNSFLSSLIICITVGILIFIMQFFAQAAGFGPEAGEELVGLSELPGISYPLISVTVAIFSTLGAVAEAGVAMSSGLLELHTQHPQLSKQELLKSGNIIGRDILGTTINTILFGMFGSFLPLFIWYFRLHYNLSSILNDKLFINEALIIMYSVVAVLLIIPLSTKLLVEYIEKGENDNEN